MSDTTISEFEIPDVNTVAFNGFGTTTDVEINKTALDHTPGVNIHFNYEDSYI